jgi:hypothetical protein
VQAQGAAGARPEQVREEARVARREALEEPWVQEEEWEAPEVVALQPWATSQ